MISVDFLPKKNLFVRNQGALNDEQRSLSAASNILTTAQVFTLKKRGQETVKHLCVQGHCSKIILGCNLSKLALGMFVYLR